MKVEDVLNSGGTEASGNNIEEARYHALCEVLELGFNNNYFRDIPVESYILNTEEMFPELPKILHDNIIAHVNKDSRIPLYDLVVVRNPNKDDFFMSDLITVDDDTISIPPPTWNLKSPNNVAQKEIKFPSLTGRRVGMNIDKLFLIAIGEMLQVLDGDLILDNNVVKKDVSNYMNLIDSKELEEFETNTIESDNSLLIDSFSNAGYNLWEIDITINEDFPTVKIINDYTMGAAHPCSKQFLSKYFEM